jgi:hypothetical protein
MRKNHVRRAEYEIFEFHMRIDRHGISKPARVAHNGVPLDVGVLAETAVFADQGSRRDVGKIPYLGVFSDCRTVLYDRGRMYKRPRSVLLDFSQSLFLSSRAAKRTSNSASRARSRSLARSIACWPRGLFYNKKSCHRSSEITLVRPRSFYSISPSKSTPQAPRSASSKLPWNTGSTPFHGRRERCSIAAPSSVSRSEPLPKCHKTTHISTIRARHID